MTVLQVQSLPVLANQHRSIFFVFLLGVFLATTTLHTVIVVFVLRDRVCRRCERTIVSRER